MSDNQKHIHIVGICGVATSALAIALHDNGWKVTGSDKGFFPPVSTELEKHNIEFYAGWHPEKMIEKGVPDIVVATTFAGSGNPEILYVQEKGILLKPYMEMFRDYFIKPNSIVCAGTWGKTSSSALLSFILVEAGLDPTYMFGGISPSHKASARLGNSQYSVFEGDEYKSSSTDNTPKFFYYKPKYLMLSAISWDHADLYPTESSYFQAFEKLIKNIPENGLVIANRDNNKIKELVKRAVWYGKNNEADYKYYDIEQSKNGLDFTIENKGNKYKVHSPMIGEFQAENITGCLALASELGIDKEKIINSINKFQGLKRRLEKRFERDITVFDDIAHSPEKASSVIKTLRKIYSGKLIVVFEPNTGGRKRDSIKKYDNAFNEADDVIVPRLTKLKVSENSDDNPIEGEELASIISKTKKDVRYISNDNDLVNYLISNTKKDDIIAFLGSHGFRGMIEETVRKLY